jgi:hypothetical protein
MRRSYLAWLAALLVGALALSAYAQDETTSTPTSNSSTSSEPTLRRDMLVSMGVVRDFFPDVNRYTTEANSAPLGKPIATRTANYTTKDGAKTVTLSVAQYQDTDAASAAYKEADQKNQLAESNPIALSNVGQQVFANMVTQGAATRVLITSLEGPLLVEARLAGYDATTDNISRLADLARREIAQADAHVISRKKR